MKKKNIKQKKAFILLTLTIVFGLFFVMALTITEVTTPTGTTSNSSVLFEYNLSFLGVGETMNNLIWSWDSTNYSIYDDSLVGMWNFNNFSSIGENNTYAVDISKYSNNGTITGATFNETGGKYNGAFEFDNGAEYINLGNPTSLNFDKDKDYTFAFWIYPEDDDDEQNIYTKGLFTGGFRIYRRWNTNILHFQERTSDEQFFYTGLDEDEWTHVIIKFNGSTTSSEIWINGVSQSVTTTAGFWASVSSTTADSFIGNDGSALNGTLDDFIIFNRSLSNSEGQELYYSSLTKYNSQNWTLNINQSLEGIVNSTNPSTDYDYYLCSSNSTGSENCTTSKTITKLVTEKTLTANFTTSLGDIRNDFYGANTGGRFLTGDGATYGTKITGESEYLNVTEYLDAWKDTNMNYIRSDMNLNFYYQDTTDPSGVNFTDDSGLSIQQQIDNVQLAKDNGYKILYITTYMPNWLADNSSGQCLNLDYCPPSNYTKWNNIVLDFLDRVDCTTSICEIEIWNEPDVEFWMGNLSVDHIDKALNYSILYNSTYLAVKGTYPNMAVGGPSQAFSWQPNMRAMFLSNFSNQFDFYSFHSYLDGNDALGTNLYDYQKTQLDNLYTDCVTYGADCSRVIISEWNDEDNVIKNTTLEYNNYAYEIALGYFATLEKSENVTNILYQFGQPSNYTSGDLWQMFTGSQLNSPVGMYGASYNTTKSFATYHSAGSTIYNSTSSDSSIKTVSSKKDDDYFITVINTDTEAKNVTVDTGGLLTKITNQETGEEFSSTTGEFQVGVMDSFEILYLGYEGVSAGGLVARLKLDELSGTTAYDVSNFSNDGTISGATWNDDTIDVALTNGVDYSINLGSGIFTLLNIELDRTGINSTYSFGTTTNKLGSSADNISIGVAAFFSNSITWFSLLAIVVILLIIAIIILTVKRFEGSPFSQVNSGASL